MGGWNGGGRALQLLQSPFQVMRMFVLDCSDLDVRTLGLVLGVFFVGALVGTPVHAQIYVDKDATGAGTGTSWADAYTDLQTAIDAATGSDEIWVAEGVYTPDSESDSFTITGGKNGLKIYGGFQNGDTFSERDAETKVTVLSGDIGNDDNNKTADGVTPTASDIAGDENAHHVLFLDGTTGGNITNSTVIDGVTVTAGQADGSGSTIKGGGLYCEAASLNAECRPEIRNALFVGNAAETETIGGNGGAIFNAGTLDGRSSPKIIGVTFLNNAAGGKGGAIYNDGNGSSFGTGASSPIITNSTFIGNKAVFDHGGAIFNEGANGGHSNPTIINSTFVANKAGFGSGSGNAGAIYTDGKDGFGGNGDAEPTLKNLILWDNRATNAGDQMYNLGAGANPTISHSILEGGLGAISENSSSSTTDGGGNLDKDPQFTGGPAAAGTDGAFGTRDDSLNLALSSPALDAGDNAALDTTGNSVRDITTDIAGADRVQDLDDNGTATVNIGAYETIDGYTRRIVGTDGTGNDTGWRMLALPAAGRTRADLEDDLDFSVPSGSILYRYEGGAWTAKTASSASLPRGTGFMLYFFDDSIDPLTGQGMLFGVETGSEDQTTDKTVGSLDKNQRFHLLGNPYDAAFDLGGLNLAGQGFQTTVRVYDPATGNYEPIIQGNAGDEIAAWQGLVVERSTLEAGTTSLTFAASSTQSGGGNLVGSKATTDATRAASVQQARIDLRLVVTGDREADTVATDRMTAFLSEKATAGWDPYEATQLPSPDGDAATVSSPFARDDGNVRRFVASEPYPNADTVHVPVSVQTNDTEGTATFAWPTARRETIPDDWTVTLTDTDTGKEVDLRDEELTFQIGSDAGAVETPSDSRFRLSVRSAVSERVGVARFRGTATGKNIQLQWEMASPQGGSDIRVERRITDEKLRETDGKRTNRGGGWTTVGVVEGGESTYQFTDTDPPYAADSLTYRLQSATNDGRKVLADPITIARSGPERLELLGTVPNPVRNQAMVRFAVPKGTDAESVTMHLYDVLGRVVQTIQTEAEPGRHTHRLNVQRLASGMYVLCLEADGETRTQKLTVVR